MIEKLSGTYIASLPAGIIVDTGGVGYAVHVPLSSLCELPPINSKLSLWIYTYVREDSIRLYGFLTYVERLTFEILISLNGVGPKVALAMLSTLKVEVIKNAIINEKSEIFEIVPGIGKRLAEKIMVDLKPKLKKLFAAENFEHTGGAKQLGLDDVGLLKGESTKEFSPVIEDVRSALENLGFKDKNITPILIELYKKNNNIEFASLMKLALVKLTSPLDKKTETFFAGKNAHETDLF